MKIYTGTSNRSLAENVCKELSGLTEEEVQLSKAYVGRFDDGEVAVRIGVEDFNTEHGVDEARGEDVFIIQSTQPPDENITELELMIDALSRQSPRRITAVIPYLGYARQDRKDKSGKPISVLRVARRISDSFLQGVTPRVVLMDLHADQIEGFFTVPVERLYASYAFVPFAQSSLGWNEFTVGGPDAGSAEMTGFYARVWGQNSAIADKRRLAPGQSEIRRIMGEVKERALIVDDLGDGLGTIYGFAYKLAERGAKQIRAWVVHPVFSREALERLADPVIEKIYVSDSIPLTREVEATGKVEVVSVASMLAQAIYRIHNEESLTPLVIQL